MTKQLTKRGKIVSLGLLVAVILFAWQSWNKVSFNDFLGRPLIVRQSLAGAEVAVVHACGLALSGTLTTCTQERVDWAFKLWQENTFPRFIVTGGLVRDGYTEAKAMGRYLEQLGAPSSSITLEDQSTNTWENALYSRAILEKNNWSKVLIITSPFHSGRTYLVWQKVCQACELESYPPLISWVTQPGLGNRWSGLRSIIREYVALAYYKLRNRI